MQFVTQFLHPLRDRILENQATEGVPDNHRVIRLASLALLGLLPAILTDNINSGVLTLLIRGGG